MKGAGRPLPQNILNSYVYTGRAQKCRTSLSGKHAWRGHLVAEIDEQKGNISRHISSTQTYIHTQHTCLIDNSPPHPPIPPKHQLINCLYIRDGKLAPLICTKKLCYALRGVFRFDNAYPIPKKLSHTASHFPFFLPPGSIINNSDSKITSFPVFTKKHPTKHHHVQGVSRSSLSSSQSIASRETSLKHLGCVHHHCCRLSDRQNTPEGR